jgi:hypothetical protein
MRGVEEGKIRTPVMWSVDILEDSTVESKEADKVRIWPKILEFTLEGKQVHFLLLVQQLIEGGQLQDFSVSVHKLTLNHDSYRCAVKLSVTSLKGSWVFPISHVRDAPKRILIQKEVVGQLPPSEFHKGHRSLPLEFSIIPDTQ